MMKIQKTKQLHFFVLQIFLYALNDMMTSPSVGFVNTNRSIVYILLISINLFMLVKLIKKNKISYNPVIVSMMVFFIWQIFIQILHSSISWGKFIEIGLSLWWPITILFIINRQENINDKKVMDRFVKFMVLFYSIFSIYAAYNITKNFQVDIARVNLAYYVIVFVPFILTFVNKRDKTLLLVVVFAISLLSMKRGAIIIFPLMILVNVCVNLIVNNKIRLKNVLKALFFIMVTLIMLLIANSMSGGFLLSRFTYDQIQYGSGRTELVELVVDNIKHRNIVEFMFGLKAKNEFNSSTGVHNEWLRVFYGQGVIALLLYGNILIQLFKSGFRIIKAKSLFAGPYWALLTYYSIIVLIGGVYYVHSTFYLMLFLGYVFSNLKVDVSQEKIRSYEL